MRSRLITVLLTILEINLLAAEGDPALEEVHTAILTPASFQSLALNPDLQSVRVGRRWSPEGVEDVLNALCSSIYFLNINHLSGDLPFFDLHVLSERPIQTLNLGVKKGGEIEMNVDPGYLFALQKARIIWDLPAFSTGHELMILVTDLLRRSPDLSFLHVQATMGSQPFCDLVFYIDEMAGPLSRRNGPELEFYREMQAFTRTPGVDVLELTEQPPLVYTEHERILTSLSQFWEISRGMVLSEGERDRVVAVWREQLLEYIEHLKASQRAHQELVKAGVERFIATRERASREASTRSEASAA